MSAFARISFAFLLCVALLSSAVGVALADPPEPSTPAVPPRQPADVVDLGDDLSSAASDELSILPLKAVLIVGPIDGDNGPWTTLEKANMDRAAAELETNGVSVHKFYAPENDWEQIKAVADAAQFLMYRGHGVFMTGTSPIAVGGFSLSSGFKLSSTIRSDLKLSPGAIVMLYGCFTAGSSSDDYFDIGITEARRRVAQYSDPFFDIGAAGYYANWHGSAFQAFVTSLFQRQTLGEAYESFFDYSASTVNRGTHPDHPSDVMWLDKDLIQGYWQYDNAFAGQADKTLEDLFGCMTVTPAAQTHLATPSDPVHHYLVTVRGPAGTSFDWTAELPSEVTWASISPDNGANGDSIAVSVAAGGMPVGVYETDIHIVAEDPKIVEGDQAASLRLVVTDSIHNVFLPQVVR